MTTYYQVRGKQVARYQHSVIRAVETLRRRVTADWIPAEDALTYREFLLARLADWEPTVNHELCFLYDEAVRQLCIAAVAMYEKRDYVEDLEVGGEQS